MTRRKSAADFDSLSAKAIKRPNRNQLNRRSRVLLQLALVGMCALLTAGRLPAQDSPVVLQSATIETIDKAGQIKGGSIVLHKGKITAVGAKVTAPETAKVISRQGKTIMPALIEPYRVISVAGRGASTTRLIRFRGRIFRIRSRGSFSSTFMRVGDNLDPYKVTLRPWLRSGIARINLVSSGFGQSAHIQVTPDKQASLLRSDTGRLFTAVTNSSTTLDLLRKGLGPAKSSSSSKKSSASSSTKTSPTAALWADIRAGKTPIVINANSPAAVVHLLKILAPHPNVKVALVVSGATLYQTVAELKKRKSLTLILSPSIVNVPNTFDRFSPARLATQAGLPFAFSLSLNVSQMQASQDTPLFSSALNVRSGVKRDTVLAALTKQPAEILGLEKTLGTLAVGKAANLLVFSGDPLDPASRLEQVYIDGSIVYDATR